MKMSTRRSTQDKRIVVGVDFKDKTLASWRTVPQKKELLCIGSLEKTTSKQRHLLILQNQEQSLLHQNQPLQNQQRTLPPQHQPFKPTGFLVDEL
jgi:hypothetical protein